MIKLDQDIIKTNILSKYEKDWAKQEGHDGPGSLTWENMNQMLNMAIYIANIWNILPSELLFYPASGSGDEF